MPQTLKGRLSIHIGNRTRRLKDGAIKCPSEAKTRGPCVDKSCPLPVVVQLVVFSWICMVAWVGFPNASVNVPMKVPSSAAMG